MSTRGTAASGKHTLSEQMMVNKRAADSLSAREPSPNPHRGLQIGSESQGKQGGKHVPVFRVDGWARRGAVLPGVSQGQSLPCPALPCPARDGTCSRFGAGREEIVLSVDTGIGRR